MTFTCYISHGTLTFCSSLFLLRKRRYRHLQSIVRVALSCQTRQLHANASALAASCQIAGVSYQLRTWLQPVTRPNPARPLLALTTIHGLILKECFHLLVYKIGLQRYTSFTAYHGMKMDSYHTMYICLSYGIEKEERKKKKATGPRISPAHANFLPN